FLAYPGRPDGLRTFLDDVDHFSNVIVRGEKSTQVRQPEGAREAAAEATQGEESTKNSAPEQKPESDGDKVKEGRVQFRASHVLKAMFFFIETFLVANYYGVMWRYRYETKLKRGE